MLAHSGRFAGLLHTSNTTPGKATKTSVTGLQEPGTRIHLVSSTKHFDRSRAQKPANADLQRAAVAYHPFTTIRCRLYEVSDVGWSGIDRRQFSLAETAQRIEVPRYADLISKGWEHKLKVTPAYLSVRCAFPVVWSAVSLGLEGWKCFDQCLSPFSADRRGT